MIICEWSDLLKNDFLIYNVQVIDLFPWQRTYDSPPSGRECNGFMYIIEGECKIRYPSGSFMAGKEGLVYLPDESHHSYDILSGTMHYIRMNFKIRNLSGESVALSVFPQLIFEKTPSFYRLKSEELVDSYLNIVHGYKLKCTSLMYDFLFNLTQDKYNEAPHHTNTKKISKGIIYLEQNFISEITTHTLAEICSLSDSQFRRLFTVYTGMTPVEYRNKLRLEKAYDLLKNSLCNVTEAAYKVGFNDAFYFSKLFKKHIGQTPVSL